MREGKVDGLLAAGADDVLVVAEGPGARLDELEDARRRAWSSAVAGGPTTCDGALLCVAASRDPGERAAIAREARSVACS